VLSSNLIILSFCSPLSSNLPPCPMSACMSAFPVGKKLTETSAQIIKRVTHKTLISALASTRKQIRRDFEFGLK
jgi:hypothetical protein